MKSAFFSQVILHNKGSIIKKMLENRMEFIEPRSGEYWLS